MIDPGEVSGWVSDHRYQLALVVALFFLAWLAWSLLRGGRRVRRDAVRHAMREAFNSGDREAANCRLIGSTGNLDTNPCIFGEVLGVRVTSHAFFVRARPARGLFRRFKRRWVLVPRHLVMDTKTELLEVRALGFSRFEGVYRPNDDLTDPSVVEAWERVLGPTKDEPASLQSRIDAWFQLVITREVMLHEVIVAMDDHVDNMHNSMTAPFPLRAPSEHVFHIERRSAAREDAVLHEVER
jgi:hypothetical protein